MEAPGGSRTASREAEPAETPPQEDAADRRIDPDPSPRRPVPRTVVAALVVGVLVVSGAVALNVVTGALERLNPFRNGIVQERTVDRSGPAVLKAITDLGEFKAASGYYELVIDVEKDVDNVPAVIAGRRVLFVAAGTVEAGVDLRSLDTSRVSVDAARTTATLTLPKPTLSEPRLDVDRSYVYSRERGLVDRLGEALGAGADDDRELYALASRRLAEAARSNDELTRRAQDNTRSALAGLLHSLGFKDVTVVFA